MGAKIDSLFLEILELTFTSAYLSKDQKLPYIQKAAAKLDLLKFFLQIAWEIKSLDNKKYQMLAEPLVEIGKMFGGWIRQIQSQAKPNPANKSGAGK